MVDWSVLIVAAIAAIIFGVFAGRARANRIRNLGASVKRGEAWGLSVILVAAVIAILIVYLGD